jgi:PmbA protein
VDRRIAEKVLWLAAARKTAAAELYLRSSLASSVEVRDQRVDAFDRARDAGAGLRIVTDGRLGFAFTNDLTDASLRALVDAAVTGARYSEPDPYAGIPGRPARPYPKVAIFDEAVPAVTPQEMIDRVKAMEREAFAVDPRVKRIRKASATFSSSETLIMNSHGAEVSYRGTAVSASIEVVAEDRGEAQAGWEHDARRYYRLLDIEAVGRKAARKAIDLLGARSVDSMKAPVILEAGVAEEFLSVMAGGFYAENVQKKKSLFIGKLDAVVASPLITICDDGLLEGGLGTAPTDDELVPARDKQVITEGRLAMFLYNLYTAQKDGVESTGNGVRGGFKGTPAVGMTNLYIRPGEVSPDVLIRDTTRGLYVTEIMGAHTANPVSGDFSVGATGFWIENGKKAYPVREITIAGNFLDLMKNVDAVCQDLRFSGRTGSPTLRIKEMSIAGK